MHGRRGYKIRANIGQAVAGAAGAAPSGPDDVKMNWKKEHYSWCESNSRVCRHCCSFSLLMIGNRHSIRKLTNFLLKLQIFALVIHLSFLYVIQSICTHQI